MGQRSAKIYRVYYQKLDWMCSEQLPLQVRSVFQSIVQERNQHLLVGSHSPRWEFPVSSVKSRIGPPITSQFRGARLLKPCVFSTKSFATLRLERVLWCLLAAELPSGRMYTSGILTFIISLGTITLYEKEEMMLLNPTKNVCSTSGLLLDDSKP